MANIAPFGRFRAFDANGAPLSGGKLYTYVAGTTTNKVTYTDKNESSSNTNPVVLDADGYADVWLDIGGYKFVLKDSSDVTQWTVDNIDGGGATGFASNVILKSSGFAMTINENNSVIVCTSAITVSLLPAVSAGNGYVAVIVNNSSGNVTIDPDGAETINGSSTLIVKAGTSATIHCSSSSWYASGVSNVTEGGTNAFTGTNTFAGASTFDGKSTFNDAVVLAGTTTVSGTLAGNVNMSEAVLLSGDITPTALSANTDNWAPTGFSAASVVRVSASAAYNLTGIASGTDGRMIMLVNVGSFSITLKHDATSTAANRFYCPNSSDFILYPNSSVFVLYDSTSSRWRVTQNYEPRIYGGTNVATTSGTSVTLTTSIPSWAKRVTVLLGSISSSGSSRPMLQLGTSSGIETSGYVGDYTDSTPNSWSTGILCGGATASNIWSIMITMMKLTGNKWVIAGAGGFENATSGIVLGGSKTLSGALTQVILTTVGGTDTFDAGSVTLYWE